MDNQYEAMRRRLLNQLDDKGVWVMVERHNKDINKKR